MGPVRSLIPLLLVACASAELADDATVDAFGAVATGGQPPGAASSADAFVPREAAVSPPADASVPRLPDASVPPPPPRDAATPPPADMAVPDVEVCEAELCNGRDDDCDGTIDEEAGCPCEHVTWDQRSYLLCRVERDWSSARGTCEAAGYSLAVIEDAAEDAFIYREISQRGFPNTWLGHNDRQLEGAWVWLDGLPMGFAHWDDGEPNDGGDDGEDCGIVMTEPARRAGKWDDRPCGRAYASVCEAPVAGN